MRRRRLKSKKREDIVIDNNSDDEQASELLPSDGIHRLMSDQHSNDQTPTNKDQL